MTKEKIALLKRMGLTKKAIKLYGEYITYDEKTGKIEVRLPSIGGYI